MPEQTLEASRKPVDVCLVSCVFPPEPVVSAKSSSQIARHLSLQGHRVTVVTSFPSRPAGRPFPGYRRRLYKWETPYHGQQGVRVLRCFGTVSRNADFLSRMVENISFGITSAGAVLSLRRADVIYSNTWPLFAAGMLALVARLRGIPLVTSVHDAYPESMAAQGRLSTSSTAFRLLRWIDRAIARSSSEIVLISRSFRPIYELDREIDERKVTVVPNWHDSGLLASSQAETQRFRGLWGVPPGSRLLLYGGNVGAAAGVETLVQAMKEQTAQTAVLVIAGDGSEFTRCRELAAQLELDNVRFHSPWPREESAGVLCAADILVLPTRGGQAFASMPSKLVSYMSAAKPIITVAESSSELARTVIEAKCGWVVEPGCPVRLANIIRHALTVPSTNLAQMGRNGLNYAQDHFSAKKCLEEMADVIYRAAGFQ